MAISINRGTHVIFIPRADLTFVGGTVYQLDMNWFRLQLKDLEDDAEGMCCPDTHRHNTELTLSGVTYARSIEIINGYTVEFEDGQYTVSCVGANHNIADVKVPNQVSLVINNSAGSQIVSVGSGLSTEEHNALMAVPGESEIANAVWAAQILSSYTPTQILEILAAASAGKLSGANTTNIKIRDIADTKDVIDATVDQSGNRQQVNINVS